MSEKPIFEPPVVVLARDGNCTLGFNELANTFIYVSPGHEALAVTLELIEDSAIRTESVLAREHPHYAKLIDRAVSCLARYQRFRAGWVPEQITG